MGKSRNRKHESTETEKKAAREGERSSLSSRREPRLVWPESWRRPKAHSWSAICKVPVAGTDMIVQQEIRRVGHMLPIDGPIERQTVLRWGPGPHLPLRGDQSQFLS